MSILHTLIYIYIWILFVTAILSWFPVQNTNGPYALLKRLLADVTEPVLRPIRSIMPRTGGIDFSVFIAIVILIIINEAI
ncbi:MAG TPA: YggT family protein [Acidimicrobiales bacterium]|jgi:YggT family protein